MRAPELLAAATRFDQAVGEQAHPLTGGQDARELRPGVAEPEPERRRRLLVGIGLAGEDRRLVPGFGPGQLAGRVLVAADDDRGKPVAELAAQVPVRTRQHLGQRMPLAHQRPQRVADERRMDERLTAVAGNVTDDDAGRLGRHREHVEEIPSGRQPLGRPVGHRHLEVAEAAWDRGQKRGLQDAEVREEPRALTGQRSGASALQVGVQRHRRGDDSERQQGEQHSARKLFDQPDERTAGGRRSGRAFERLRGRPRRCAAPARRYRSTGRGQRGLPRSCPAPGRGAASGPGRSARRGPDGRAGARRRTVDPLRRRSRPGRSGGSRSRRRLRCRAARFCRPRR